MDNKRPAQALFWALAAAAVCIDQLTKWAIYERSVTSRAFVVVPGVFFRLAPTGNPGVVWGLFGGWPGAVFAVGVLAAMGVTYFFYRYCEKSLKEAAALGIILGGAVGNLSDRAFVGHVRDFLEFKIYSHYWPTFNFADSFITVGAGILIVVFLSSSKGEGGRAQVSGGKSEK